ncbi:MAG: hypothetical protein ACKOPQ_08290 [Novosphingobium sp.]
MRFHWPLLSALLLIATPAQAEKLQFDHRLYPPLKEVLDSGDQNKVAFDSSRPGRMVDFITIKGKSVKSWTEGFEIVALARPKQLANVQEWMAFLRKGADQRCPNTVTVIAQDERSVTFERHSPKCPGERAEFGLYRLVTGQRSWFQLTLLSKAPLTSEERSQWLALLASAHLD